jgi:hypothetical protein
MPRINNEPAEPVVQSPAQEVRSPSPKKRKRVEESDNNDLYGKLPPEMRHKIMKTLPPKALASLMATSKTARTEALEFSKTDEGKMKFIPYLLNLLITGKVTLEECPPYVMNLLRKKFKNASNLESFKLVSGDEAVLTIQYNSLLSSQRDMSDVTNLVFSHESFRLNIFDDDSIFIDQLRRNTPNLKNIKLRDIRSKLGHDFLNQLVELNGLKSVDLSDCLLHKDFVFDNLNKDTSAAISGYFLHNNKEISNLEKIPQNLKTIRLGFSNAPTENEWKMIRDKLGKDSQLKIRNNSMGVRDTPPVRADQIPEDLRPYVTSYQWSDGEDIEHVLDIFPQLKELTVNLSVPSQPLTAPIEIPENIDQGIQQALLSKGIQLRIGNTNKDEVYVKNEGGTAFILADDDNTLFI